MGYITDAYSRVNGRAFIVEVNWSTLTDGWQFSVCSTPDLGDADDITKAQGFYSSSTESQYDYTTGTVYQLAIILRTTGVWCFYRSGTSGNWTLAGIGSGGADATVYGLFSNTANVGTVDTVQVVDLPAPYTTQYGIATNRLVSPSAGATTAATADAVIEWTFTYTTGQIMQLMFRRTDDNNCWVLSTSNATTLALSRYSGGSLTPDVGTSSFAPVNGETYRLLVFLVGTTITVYVEGFQKMLVVGATAHQTATGIKYVSGSGTSEVVAWPATLDLSAAVAAGTLLVNDQFTTAAASGFTAVRPAEPGPGVWSSVVDSLRKLSTVGGRLVVAGNGAGWGDPRLIGPSTVRTVGRALVGSFQPGSGSTYNSYFGWTSNAAGGAYSNAAGGAVSEQGGASLVTYNDTAGGAPQIDVGIAAAAVTRQMVVLRTTGFFAAFEVGGVWKLGWVGAKNTTTPLYPAFVHSNAGGAKSLANVDILDLPAPFTTDFGLATSRTKVATGTTAAVAHTADFLLDLTYTQADGAAAVVVQFRKLDSLNYVELRIADVGSDATGTLTVYENGVGRALGQGTGWVFGTARVMLVVEGSTYRLYRNDVLVFAVSDPNCPTFTGSGASVSAAAAAAIDLVFWPRVLPLPPV